MKQRTSTQHGSPLLDYAIAKLNPGVFSHPVWVRFAQHFATSSLNLVSDLMSVAKSLQEDDPSTACQVLLICAVYQTRAGQLFNALKTTQQALALAQSTRLGNEMIWAMWGTCAIALQQGNYEQATNSLVDLQATLSDQNEWILADFVEILRQSVPESMAIRNGNHSGTDHNGDFEGIVSFTVDWFRHWGFAIQSFGSTHDMPSLHAAERRIEEPAPQQPLFPVEHTQDRWHNLMLGIRGELRFQWTKRNSPVAQKKYSFWRGLLHSLGLSTHEENTINRAPGHHLEADPHRFLPPAEEISHPDVPTDRSEPISVGATKDEAQHSTGKPASVPVSVHMLGAFSLTIGDLTVKLSSSRGLSIFKYLLFHHKQSTPREVLMDIFWPDSEPETARNSLNVAIHGLRKALRNAVFLPVIIFEDGAYRLEENLQVWLDVEEFEQCIKAGQRLEARHQLAAAVTEYETAISLYQGDFLEETPYEESTVFDRERLRIAYLDMLDRLSQIYFSQERYSACRTACQLLLIKDPCREDAHCLLMRCYSRQRQPHLALYQYQVCVEALRGELQVDPAPETTQLYNRIRRRESV